MRLQLLTCKVIYCAFLILPTSASAGTLPSEEPSNQLEVVEQKRRAEILAVPGVDWSAYTGIQLERASVDFRKNWVRDQRNRNGNRISAKDQQRIKSDLADLLDEVLIKEFTTKGGYNITQESGAGVMRFTPRVEDLEIVAPDRVRDHIGYSLADSQGWMTLKLEIHDSVSGELIATTSHFKEDRDKGYLEWTTQGTNRRAARFMLESWTKNLLKWLGEAQETSPDE